MLRREREREKERERETEIAELKERLIEIQNSNDSIQTSLMF